MKTGNECVQCGHPAGIFELFSMCVPCHYFRTRCKKVWNNGIMSVVRDPEKPGEREAMFPEYTREYRKTVDSTPKEAEIAHKTG